MIPPLVFLAALLAATALAAMLHWSARRRRVRRLGKLASDWGMRFAPDDRFDLAPRVAAGFPVPGAAAVAVGDLIYCQEGACYRYFFTVQYTLGILRAKRRLEIAAALTQEKTGAGGGEGYSAVQLAPSELESAEQYEWLRNRVGGEGSLAMPLTSQGPPADFN